MQLVEFSGGREDFLGAAAIAARCKEFTPDSADEWVVGDLRSCYNCKNRRWTTHSFSCLKHCLPKDEE
jgi:hypothetical protein